jgi:hypothetical protein
MYQPQLPHFHYHHGYLRPHSKEWGFLFRNSLEILRMSPFQSSTVFF